MRAAPPPAPEPCASSCRRAAPQDKPATRAPPFLAGSPMCALADVSEPHTAIGVGGTCAECQGASPGPRQTASLPPAERPHTAAATAECFLSGSGFAYKERATGRAAVRTEQGNNGIAGRRNKERVSQQRPTAGRAGWHRGKPTTPGYSSVHRAASHRPAAGLAIHGIRQPPQFTCRR
jgi:hypothetical protein